jgi:hypothetical protein
MASTRILITVKTYPTISRTYGELVCTAGVTEDGQWVRIYPVPFRKLDYNNRYKKYQWITADLEKNTKDFRPESHKLTNPNSIVIGEIIPTDNNWELRRKYCLKQVHNSLTRLIEEAYDKSLTTSLATYKPDQLIDFEYVAADTSRHTEKARIEKLKQDQLDLFSQLNENERLQDPDWYNPVDAIPYKFFYRFRDADGKIRRLMIEDWEIFELYRNCLKRERSEEAALEKVRCKYWDEFRTKDLHFFLGTTLEFHRRRAPNPFIIIGVFYPPPHNQASLF